jgi:hypothetical protein
MLGVDGEKIEVSDPHARNVVRMEERFDLSLSWAQAVPISYTTMITDGVKGSASDTRSKHQFEVSCLHSNNPANARCATRAGSLSGPHKWAGLGKLSLKPGPNAHVAYA